ncbi:hypothetical protein EMIHUDRAFT_232788 [Emiliania huxleyi CCMP1516]|uniref:Uncharacterized protein n=2 Tax=Emiliania huxleyi TaxID=2903 RepID=A0A0D3K3X1_EMIH1|nr:hypothetical protein EMIHUDRAFT_232788 [Emiliania huxleyi CCMP1516]EOD30456.1 hypothetical protein EMIHUDRAFT_232788 [Emiliania huxleyi CCMP1516]|eukprot:XP_005782885.1 hypothetical protein EMIHUDRAFT_232788 [Emiliania huxleyi CCMP1516]
MRFYIHHDGDPEFTLAVSWAPTDRRAVRDLCALVAKRLPATAGTRHISLVTENGVELPAGHCVCACVREGADLIAKSVARPPSQPAPAAAANAAEDLEPYLKAADKAYAARQLARAKTIYTELLGVSPRLFTALLRLGLIEEQAGRHEEACHWLQRAVREDPASEEAAVALARSHLAAGEGEEAAAAVRAALERCGSGAGGKAGGKAAAKACVALGQHDDALKIFLRLVTQRSDDSAVRRLLAASLGSKDGMALLRQQLAFDAKSASALAFLATIARDHSKLSASLELIAEAARLVPDASAYALQRAHTLEVELRYADALEAVREHCDANPQRAAAGVRCADVAALLPTREQCEAARWRPPSAPPSASPCKGTAEEAALRAAATEIRDLHLTLIRNENAYYCCAAMLLATPPPQPADPPLAPLYVAGDSHALSPSWRVVRWRGQPRVLVPVLVTGLKLWHLRDGADFFPKANFEAAAASLPDGADVVFAFGEIDCREGLLLAVERARYRDLAQAIDTVVDIYIRTLRRLAARRRFNILVPPVLPETRAVVKQFNAALRRAVERASPVLAWLDFFEQLLTPAGDALADGLALDGTHLNPQYVRLLEAALPA